MANKTITIGVPAPIHGLLKQYAAKRGFSLKVAITKAIERLAKAK